MNNAEQKVNGLLQHKTRIKQNYTVCIKLFKIITLKIFNKVCENYTHLNYHITVADIFNVNLLIKFVD